MRGTVLHVGLLVAWVACGGEAFVDGSSGDGSGGAASSARASNATGASGVSTSVGPGGGAANTPCRTACSDLYDCGLEIGPRGKQLCQGFDGTDAQKDAFMYGQPSGSQGCVAACDARPIIIELVDTTSCPTTIRTLKKSSAFFADWCDNGF
jgi:hypothetical protein